MLDWSEGAEENKRFAVPSELLIRQAVTDVAGRAFTMAEERSAFFATEKEFGTRFRKYIISARK